MMCVTDENIPYYIRVFKTLIQVLCKPILTDGCQADVLCVGRLFHNCLLQTSEASDCGHYQRQETGPDGPRV